MKGGEKPDIDGIMDCLLPTDTFLTVAVAVTIFFPDADLESVSGLG